MEGLEPRFQVFSVETLALTAALSPGRGRIIRSCLAWWASPDGSSAVVRTRRRRRLQGRQSNFRV